MEKVGVKLAEGILRTSVSRTVRTALDLQFLKFLISIEEYGILYIFKVWDSVVDLGPHEQHF
jgi:hypothetical protein